MARIPLSRRLLYAVATLALLAGGAEGVSRLVWSAEDTAINPGLAYLADHPTLLWTLRPGLIDYETHDGFTLTTNSLGLRDDEISPRPPATRILSMGESTTWGHGVPGEKTYSQRLEQRLQDDGADAEVINAGIGAWTIWQSYVFLVEHGIELGPDAVLLYHLHNDSLPRGVVDANNHLYQVRLSDREFYEARLPWRHLLGLLYRSRLYLMLRRSLLTRGSDLPQSTDGVSEVTFPPRVPPADRQVALEGIAAICQSMGAELIVLMPVYKNHPGHDDILREFSASTGARLIDLPAHKRAVGVPDSSFFIDPIHPSIAGHDWIAGWIHDEIADESWIR